MEAKCITLIFKKSAVGYKISKKITSNLLVSKIRLITSKLNQNEIFEKIEAQLSVETADKHVFI